MTDQEPKGVADPRSKRPLCHATRTDGEPCRNLALPGLAVCRFHGGGAPRAQAKSKAEIARRELVRKFGAPADVGAIDAYRTVLSRAVSMVDWIGSQLELAPLSVSGFVASVEEWSSAVIGPEPGDGPSLLIEERETTEFGERVTLKANPLLDQYRAEREHLFKVAATGIKFGLTELQLKAFVEMHSDRLREAVELLEAVVSSPELADVADRVRAVVAGEIEARRSRRA